MADIEREIIVRIELVDREGYGIKARQEARRTFPADSSPAVIAGWAGRTAIAQVREANRSYPIEPPAPPKPPEEVLADVAEAPDDAAAEKAAGDVDDLPF